MNLLKRISSCSFIALLAIACGRDGTESKVAAPGAPVIIISIDTLRADHLPAYGYEGVQTPAIDALRRDSILYLNAYSHAPLTLPSHASVLTGLLPQTHKVRNNIGYRLDPGVLTIPAMLKPAGYESGGAISAYVLRSSTGIGESFDFYDDGLVGRPNVPIGAVQRAGADTVAIAKPWISARKEKPFFFMLHIFEPHAPYDPPEPFKSRFKLPYDGEIATADQIVGDFIESLKRDGVYDKAVIILLSDHGEGLSQHGEPEHGIFLYREAIRVPLMLKLPSSQSAGETVARAVGLYDILPTVAELTGTKVPDGVEGSSLLRAGEASAARRIYSETLYPRIHLGWSELRSLADAKHHYIDAPRAELYDVQNDAAQTKNILGEERRVYASMRGEMEKYRTEVEMPVELDPEEARKLAALGYLGSSAGQRTGPLPDPKDGMPEMAAMMQAMKFANEGHHAEAVDRLRQIVAKNPLLTDAWNQLAFSLETLGRYEEAIAAYRQAIETTPALATEFGLRLAGVYIRTNELEKAAEHARLGEKANYSGAHMLLARIALERKDFTTAEAEARLAMRNKQDDIHAKLLLARIYNQQDRPREALALAEEVARDAERRKAGTIESLHFVVGDALARMQQYAPAEQALKREIELFPRNRQAYASLYVIYALTNRFPEADAILEAMVRANPGRGAIAFAAHTTEALGDTRGTAKWRARAAAAR